jgi:peptidyl-prolyl cis-trans isomerase SurA
MTRILLPSLRLAALLSLLLLHPGPALAATVDRIVAIVNDEVITQTELDQEGRRTFAAISKTAKGDDLTGKLAEAREKVLQTMIDDRLISQKAKELKIETTSAEVEEAINNMATEHQIPRDKLLQELAAEGISEADYRLRLGEQISRSKLINAQIRSKIVINEERARQFYQEVYLKEEPPAGYYLLQMGFRWSGKDAASATKEEAVQRAERIRKLVQDGQDFRELAHSVSELPSGSDGGDLGAIGLSDMAPDMRALLSDLSPGQVSRVSETGDSIQFFQVLTINTDNQPRFPPYELVSSSIRERMFQEEMKSRLENWMKELREQAMIKKLN